MNFKRRKRKIKTINGYLPGDGPRGNSKVDQKHSQSVEDLIVREELEAYHMYVLTLRCKKTGETQQVICCEKHMDQICKMKQGVYEDVTSAEADPSECEFCD